MDRTSMKIIKSDSGFLLFQKLFKHFVVNQSVIVAWQSFSEGKRVGQVQLHSFNYESGLLHFGLRGEVVFETSLPVFFYAEEGALIFKSAFIDLKDTGLSVNFPTEIQVLGEEDVERLSAQLGERVSTKWVGKRLDLENLEDGEGGTMRIKSMAERSTRDQDFLNNEFDLMSVDEEDKMFADKRSSPRARPKEEKWVKVKNADHPKVHYLKLFDLSRGGMSFITVRAEDFVKGTEIYVTGFDTFDLDDPLVGTVMSLRPLDEIQVEYKIGIKFRDGQS